ncbi:MAG TPA: ABC transporter ATP-binding protein [Kofleriaceae bacterium]|nr:ABC transporter ATP-binding protein [Kofleriaceae bacterium]
MNGAPSLGLRGALLHARSAAAMVWHAGPGWLALQAVLALLAGAAPVLTAWLTKLLLDGLVAGAARPELLGVAAALAASGIVLGLQPHATQYAMAELDRALARLAQSELCDALNRFDGLVRFEDPVFCDRLQLAQHTGRIAPSQLFAAGLGMARGAVTLVGFAGVLLATAPWMPALLVAVAAVPTLLAELSISRRRAAVAWRHTSAVRREIFYGELLSQPHAAVECRLFGLGGFFRGRLLAELDQVHAASRLVDRHELRVQGVLAAASGLAAAAALVWAILAAASGQLSAGDVVVFITATAVTQTVLVDLVRTLARAHAQLLAYDHFRAVVGAPPDLVRAANPHPAPALRDGVELRDVWFRYGDDQPWVLRGVNLTVPSGRTVALVGLNGSGKSTLVKLLGRLYDPSAGSIRWDGIDYRDLDPADLRSRIAAVFQDFMRYELSARENIRLGKLEAGEEELVAAARSVLVHDVLAALPRGYDTLLTRKFLDVEGTGDADAAGAGVQLSGGQWQRVALARSLMRGDADLLVMDEPSSGLDAEAEQEIHERLRRFRAGRSVLLISHRLSAVREADSIAVLADGAIAEQGRHDELMAAGGRYAQLFRRQAQGYREVMPC